MFEKVKRFAKKIATSKKTQMTYLMVMCGVTALMAQTTAGDYSAGTAALTQVSEEIAKYVPIVVKLCYAIAGVVAVVGAISVYIAMNNEEQDVKNILVLRNAFEKTRKQMKVNTLSINALSDNLNFPMFDKLTLKKT
ncbi:DUF4134 domain-containing protein [Bacteroides xylanisolvens]|uniref:DUF4134 domain-containing protein n=1 Tax=Bacteroides xylanisolvens TaxID=371601 RepID=UPI0021643E94|nr:DUF4134 domain-containing protein [Bacteroides xylanisolvens]UVQ08432.1 DUF4134 domain-containing protein [Bacteroides xylanisolvens]